MLESISLQDIECYNCYIKDCYMDKSDYSKSAYTIQNPHITSHSPS